MLGKRDILQRMQEQLIQSVAMTCPSFVPAGDYCTDCRRTLVTSPHQRHAVKTSIGTICGARDGKPTRSAAFDPMLKPSYTIKEFADLFSPSLSAAEGFGRPNSRPLSEHRAHQLVSAVWALTAVWMVLRLSSRVSSSNFLLRRSPDRCRYVGLVLPRPSSELAVSCRLRPAAVGPSRVVVLDQAPWEFRGPAVPFGFL